ncbi:uncharacterized protein K489DRAFT_314076 [Dissoconium aciculare CBS 342.82]|uniref:Mitochondrial F1F0-ATP synthase g subunit n=1 Tax=Dissoconium aciculare CBS 342.82 TaxID=1314786 RepID=A0A6J3MEL5_9PEZI|nr:uncharacterized protein K489DRAFT_314076 [Dissoconium aciculare CBS 342.82]KAF1825297.1 hypothetical protein K489DRAFT_314076 [Dissoconium aciculare CBS 342.82]
MSSPSLARLAIRQSKTLVQRRAASTTTEAANAASSGAAKATEAVQNTAAKAQQGLSKVTSSASSTVSNAATAAANTAQNAGGRVGQVVSFVQAGLIPPTIYYAKVGGELAKLIYTGRGMQPPTLQSVQSYLTPLQNALRNPSSLTSPAAQKAAQSAAQTAAHTAEAAAANPQSFIARLREGDHGALLTVGVVAAETLGFFSVGEIIGRFNIVGYRGQPPHGDH